MPVRLREDAPVRAGGRPRDPERDRVICLAAVELLAEVGYDCFTMDEVATRARVGKATIYRRWPSKAKLVLDAIVQIKHHPELDTGSIDGDLEALISASCSEQADFVRTVIRGTVSALSRDPELLEAFHERVTQPRIDAIEQMILRAQSRGEIAGDIDVKFVASVVPSMTLQRSLLTGKPVDTAYLRKTVDHVLRPLLQPRPDRTSIR